MPAVPTNRFRRGVMSVVPLYFPESIAVDITFLVPTLIHLSHILREEKCLGFTKMSIKVYPKYPDLVRIRADQDGLDTRSQGGGSSRPGAHEQWCILH